MSEIRASRKPFSSKMSLAAASKRASVRAPLLERGPAARSGGSSAASDDNRRLLVFRALSDRRRGYAEQAREVPAHELLDGLLRELLEQLVDRGLGMGESLGVRPVGAEEHVVLAEQRCDLAEVVLPERADVNRAPHHPDGILRELRRHLLVDALELAHQRTDPAAAVLDERQLQG